MMDQLFFNKTYNYTYKLYSIKQWEKRSNLDPIVHMVFASNVGQEKKKKWKGIFLHCVSQKYAHSSRFLERLM